MKILICISQLSKGGAERVVSNLSNYLNKNNQIIVVSLRNSEIAYEFSNNIKIEKIDSSDLKANNKITKNIKRLKGLNQIIKKEKPDIVLSFLPEPSFLTLLIKKMRKIKVIVSVRNDPNVEYKSPLYKFLMKRLYPKADGFVFQTEDAKEYFKGYIKCETVVIPNPINPEFIQESFQGEREKVIVSVGRLDEQKNHKMLIKAFHEIHKEFPEHKLIIYGEGDLRNELENLISDLKMNDFVELPGVVNNIKEKIYKASMFVLTSNYEGMPNALMEALALGIPCISTDCPCGGPKTLIKNNSNGILIKPGDEKELVDKMRKILLEKEFSRNIGIEANNIKETMNPQKINQRWENYINFINN